MKFKVLTVAALTAALPTLAAAGPDDDTLVINGEIEIATKVAARLIWRRPASTP